MSKRVENDEAGLEDLIKTVAGIAEVDNVCWTTDLNFGGIALLIAPLAAHGQQLIYIPGRIVHHAAAAYRGAGKTDAKGARIIADQARMRTDLQPVRGADQISVDLQLLTARRTDLICDRVRAINRLRATLLKYFPAPDGIDRRLLQHAVIESLCGRMQTELLNRKRWKTRIELANAIFEDLEVFHNHQRRHSALGMLTPIELENVHFTRQLVT